MLTVMVLPARMSVSSKECERSPPVGIKSHSPGKPLRGMEGPVYPITSGIMTFCLPGRFLRDTASKLFQRRPFLSGNRVGMLMGPRIQYIIAHCYGKMTSVALKNTGEKGRFYGKTFPSFRGNV